MCKEEKRFRGSASLISRKGGGTFHCKGTMKSGPTKSREWLCRVKEQGGAYLRREVRFKRRIKKNKGDVLGEVCRMCGKVGANSKKPKSL